MHSTTSFSVTPVIFRILIALVLALPLQGETNQEKTAPENKEPPYATSVQERDQEEEESPVRVDLFHPDNKSVLVQWNLKEPAEIKRFLIQQGHVFRADEKVQEFKWETVQQLQGEITQWTLPSPPAQSNTPQYLRVVAIQKNDKVLFSAPTRYSAAPTIPAHSQIRLQADRVESRSLQISWSPPVSSSNHAVVVERARASSGPWQQVGQVSPGGRIFQDRFLEPDTEYHYRVRSTQGEPRWQSEVLRIRTPR